MILTLFFNLGKIFGSRISLCALSGGLVGVIAGFFMALLQLGHPGVVFPGPDMLKIAILLSLLGWLAVLLVVGVWRHYGISAIALPALVTAFLTAFLTVFANNFAQIPVLAPLIGLLIGILIGSALCRICQKLDVNARESNHG